MPSSELDTMKNKVNELIDAVNEMSGERKAILKLAECIDSMEVGATKHAGKRPSKREFRFREELIESILQENKQEDEECEHDYEELVCKKCGYVDLDCPCGCGMSMDDDEYEESHRANYLSEEKQEDEEVEVTVKRPFRQKHAKREGLETTVRTMPKSEARRLGLID